MNTSLVTSESPEHRQAIVKMDSIGTALHQISAHDLSVLFRQKKVSPVEVTQAIIEHISAHEPILNAFALFDEAYALKSAHRSENRWMKGTPLSDIDGVAVGIKDLLLVKGWPTLRGSLAVERAQQWTEDAPAAARLREQGAVLLGKTTTSEFGWKAQADSPLTGVTLNPWNIRHTTGGSSAGAAAAGAIGFGPLQVATDGGGSCRVPAGYTGLVGFKPTFGRVPCYPAGHVGTLFHVSPMARTVRDAVLLFNAISGPDPRDVYALPSGFDDVSATILHGVKGMRIAYSADFGYLDVDPEIALIVAKAVSQFTALGAIVEQVMPPINDPSKIHRTLAAAGVARLFDTFSKSQWSRCEQGLQAVAERGRSIDVVQYLDAVQAREALTRDMDQFHNDWDILVTPTTAQSAPLADADSADPARGIMPAFAFPFNLTQQPAISIPVGFTSTGLPVGMQIVARRYRDDLVLRAAQSYEKKFPFPTLQVPR